MTSIIALKDRAANRVYMGGDRRISYLHKDGYIDDAEPKILIHGSMMFGFAGDKGIQNLCEIILPNLDLSKVDYYSIVQKVGNILALFRKDGTKSQILITDGVSKISWVDTNGNICPSITENEDFCTIGVGFDIIYGALSVSQQTNPRDKIREALQVVAVAYPKLVGGSFDIFPDDINYLENTK